jgi:hypothetical protein
MPSRKEIAVLWSSDQTWLIKEIPGGCHRWWDCGKVRFDNAVQFCRTHGVELHVVQMRKGKPMFYYDAANGD